MAGALKGFKCMPQKGLVEIIGFAHRAGSVFVLYGGSVIGR